MTLDEAIVAFQHLMKWPAQPQGVCEAILTAMKQARLHISAKDKTIDAMTEDVERFIATNATLTARIAELEKVVEAGAAASVKSVLEWMHESTHQKTGNGPRPEVWREIEYALTHVGSCRAALAALDKEAAND